jgi:hypothetical protein
MKGARSNSLLFVYFFNCLSQFYNTIYAKACYTIIINDTNVVYSFPWSNPYDLKHLHNKLRNARLTQDVRFNFFNSTRTWVAKTMH